MNRSHTGDFGYGMKDGIDDGPMQPVNYSGTQVNIFGSPPPEYVGQALQQIQTQPMGPPGGPQQQQMYYPGGQYPYGLIYPPNGYTNQVQVGFMTEHMLRKLDESRLLTMNELVRQSYGRNQHQPPAPYVQEPMSPPARVQHQLPPSQQQRALEYEGARAKPVSPGQGDWRGQLKHIYAHLMEIANEDKNFRVNIGEPKLGEIVAADLEEDDETYSLTLRFAKPRTERRQRVATSLDRRPRTPSSSSNYVDNRRPKTPVSDYYGEQERRTKAPISSSAVVRPTPPVRSAKPPVPSSGLTRGAKSDFAAAERPSRATPTGQSVTRGGWGSGARTEPVSDPRKSSMKSPAEAVIKKVEKEEVQFEKENVQQEGTLKPFKQFNAEADAEVLRKAMKGLGTDEDAITNTWAKRSSAQRQEIIKTFKTLFGKDLVKELKSELSGDYWQVVQAMCQTHADYDATELRNAIKGLGTDDDAVIEIICTRTSKSLMAIEEAYKRLFNKNLEEDIIGDTSGHYQRLLVALLQANRDESNTIDRAMAKKEAQEIFNAGVSQWGTDESAFNKILVRRSYAQLRATFQEYEKLAGKTIEEAVQNEMSGNLAQGMLTIVQCIKNKPAYFAQKLYKALKGLGTHDDSLIRILVSRSEVDMTQIKSEFQRQYKQSLAQFIADDTSGDYRKILLTLLGESTAAK